MNYALPTLGSKLYDILLGVTFGNLPWAITYSVIGGLLDDETSIKDFVDDMPVYAIVIVAFLGLLFLVLGVWAIYSYADEALQEIIRSEATEDTSNIGTETESLLHNRSATSRRSSRDVEESMEQFN